MHVGVNTKIVFIFPKLAWNKLPKAIFTLHAKVTQNFVSLFHKDMWNASGPRPRCDTVQVTHRADRTEEAGKAQGRELCFKNKTDGMTPERLQLSHPCSPNLEQLTIMYQPFYLPCELTKIIAMAVYIPPQADVLSDCQNKHPDATLIVGGDFNRSCRTSINT